MKCICGNEFTSKSNRMKYCYQCSGNKSKIKKLKSAKIKEYFKLYRALPFAKERAREYMEGYLKRYKMPEAVRKKKLEYTKLYNRKFKSRWSWMKLG